MNFPVPGYPKVTVLMPVYNAEKYLREAIESILNQTFSDFEFLILNDGSTDHSVDIIQSYNDFRINLQNSDQNKGLIYQLNLGLNLSHGKYIARMDADDISLPDRLEKQIKYLDDHPEVAVLGGAMQSMTEGGLNGSLFNVSLDVDEIARKGDLAHPTVMIRSDSIKSVNGYRNAFIAAEDYDLWLRLGESYILANLQDVLIRYRVHTDQISATRSCQQALSALGARFAAENRRKKANDPTENLSLITAESLIGIGVPKQEIESALLSTPLQEVKKLLSAKRSEAARNLVFEIDHLLCCIKSSKIARSRVAWSMSKTYSARYQSLQKMKWIIRSFLLSPLKSLQLALESIKRIITKSS